MNKILILLIGFAFTQSIQTKQVEVTITDWSLLEDGQQVDDIMFKKLDLSNYLDLNENYFVQVSDWEILDENFNSLNIFFLSRCNNSSGVVDMYSFFTDDGTYDYDNMNGFIRINSECYELDIHLAEEVPITLTFWVTGMFEDEGVGLQGDMNDDEIINVSDIVALVNVILGDE